MFLIIGATGRTGKEVLNEITAKGVPVRVLVRDASRLTLNVGQTVEVIEGDIDDPLVMAVAMQGVSCLYLSLGNFPGQEDAEHGIVRAARLAGVRKIVKLSGPSAGPDSPVAIARMHGRIEAAITGASFDFVFLRPYAFFQNLANQIAPLAHLQRLFGSTGTATLNMIDAADVGAVAATVMLSDKWDGRAIELTSEEAISYPDVARRLSRLAGETYEFVNRPPEVYQSEMIAEGLPDWVAEHVVEIQAMTLARPEVPNANVRDILGRAARGLDGYLLDLLSQIVMARACGYRKVSA